LALDDVGVDYKVILPGRVSSTASRVRVTIELSDGRESWRTMGTSTNIIEVSVSAILDGLNYHSMLTNIAKRTILVPFYLQRKEKDISDRFK
jgi:2-isopropylmalate synthase